MNSLSVNTDRSLIYIYQPPITPLPWWRGRLITVISSQGKMMAEVWEKGVAYPLPLRGIPQAIASHFQALQKFFESSFFIVGKNEDRTFSHVEVRPRLVGGTITSSDLLPMYPGYAIGSVISKVHLYLPLLNRKKQVSEKEYLKAQREKIQMMASESYVKADKDVKQNMLIAANYKINKAEITHKKIWEEIAKLCKNEISIDTLEEMLPLDINKSGIRIEKRAFESEQMNHFVFRKDSQGVPPRNQLLEQVEKFVAEMDSEQMSANSIPINVIEGVVSNIEKMLKTEAQISLVGSFMTLNRVVTMDPVVLRSGNKISDFLRQNATEYYVLTEAVLGAVFLGLGKLTSEEVRSEEEKKSSAEEANRPHFMARLAMLSFHSQGAIPQPSNNPEDISLWAVYCRWKEALVKNERSGYPIAFRVRLLSDILAENKISLLPKPEPLPPPSSVPLSITHVEERKEARTG